MSSRNNQDRRRETEDLSARRYARKPITTAAFTFIILFSGIVVISVLPSSFFFDPGALTSKIRLGDFPIGAFIPPLEQDISPQDLLQLLIDLMQSIDLLPDDLGTNINISVTPDTIPRYWRLFTYDNFDGTDWSQTNTTFQSLNYATPFSGADIYQVRIDLALQGIGGAPIPLPILWDSPLILTSPAFSITPSVNITWNLLTNEYKDAILNLTYTGINPTNCQIIYNVSYNPNANLTYIEQNVASTPPSQGASLPGKYLQVTNIPSINTYLQDFLSTISPISSTNNTYDTTLAALEYFKTRFRYNPIINTTNKDIIRFLTSGYGDSEDFATAFSLFLRYLNISTRYVMGTVGYLTITPPWLPLLNVHYWTEVWIPDSSSGGNWVQFDPTPVPYLWNYLIPMRINDDRMETDHFDLNLYANVTPVNHQNRNTDFFELKAQLLKNYAPVNRTALEPIININFSDYTNNTYLGFAQVGNNNESTFINRFFDSSLVGPHRFNASWLAITNNSPIYVTCRGTTQVYITEINGTLASSYTNLSLLRNNIIALTIKGNLTDDVNTRTVEGGLIKLYINETNQLIGSGITDVNGIFQINTSGTIPISYDVGIYHIHAYFNGTFFADFPFPFPDLSVGSIVGSESNSSEFDLILMANTSLTKNFNPSVLPLGENFTIYGNLLLDNGTGLPGQIVNAYETNSSGEFFVGTNTTIANGFYSITYFIPSDHEAGVNVTIKVNTSITSPYFMNSSVIPDPPAVIRVNFTIFEVNPLDPRRGVTNVFISGRVVHKDGQMNISNEVISILFNNSPISINTTTNMTGYFNKTFIIPLSVSPGLYTVNATTTNITYYPFKDDTNWNNLTLYPTFLNFSIDNVTPLSVVRGINPIFISGRVLINGTSNTIAAGEVISILLNNLNIINTTTNGTGHFNSTFIVPITQTPGFYIINATTTNSSYYIWQDDISNIIQVNPTWVNFSISNVTPNSVIRGVDPIFISGRVLINGTSNTIPAGEIIAILLNNTNIVNTTTNSTGHFNSTFIIPITQTPGIYIINATTTNSSYYIWQDDISNIIQVNPIWVNFSISNVTPNTVYMGKTQLFISGRVLINGSLNTIPNGEIIEILLNNTNVVNTTTNSTGYFNSTFIIPITATPGIYLINATTTNSSYYIWQDDISNFITLKYIWVNISISNVTPNSVFRGVTALFISGQVTHNDSAFNISNEQILILLNNQSIQSTITNETGHFNITFIIPSSYILGTYIINATITNPIYFILQGDISNTISINTTSAIKQLSFNYNSFRVGEFIIISGRITDNINQQIPGYKNYISIFMNSTQLSIIPPIIGINGYFIINCTIPIAAVGNHNITVVFNSSGYYLNTSLTRNINIFSDPRVKLSTPTPIVIVGSFVVVIGKAYDANNSLKIMGRSVELKMFGQTIGNFKTDSSGEFIFIMPIIGPVFTFQAYFEGSSAYESNEITILGYTQPENYNWVWIIVIIAVVVVVVIIIGKLYHRKLQIERFIESIQISNFQKKLKSLIDGNRYKEAIVFLYQIFFSKILEKLKKPPLPGLTFRELMTSLVTKIELDPNLIYPFTTNYEEARFSNHLITQSIYTNTYKLFEKLIRKSFELEQIEIEEEEPEPEIPPMENNIPKIE